MKKALLFISAMAIAIGAQAQVKEVANTYENYIQVTGRSEREVVPDEIYIRIVISENDTKGKVSVDKLENDMVAALRSLGIDVEKDLKVGDMNSDFKEYLLKRNQTRTSKTYQLKVSSASMLADVFETLGGLDISNLSVTKVSHSRMEEIQGELRTEAMVNACAIADELATAIGQGARRAVHIVDYNNDFVTPQYLAVEDAVVMASGVARSTQRAAELDFRTIKMRYNVTVKFELD